MNKQLVAIDFETASQAYYSACSLGIVVFNNTGIVSKEYLLIQPPENFYNKSNTAIHQLTSADTIDAPQFSALWAKVRHYFENSIVFAHNANFDMSVLKATLNYYGIEQPDFHYIDTKFLSNFGIPKGVKVGSGLDERCNFYNIPLEAHHNALHDAEACARLAILAINDTPSVLQYKRKKYHDIKLKSENSFFARHQKMSELKEEFQSIKELHDADFLGKTVAITGVFSKMTRQQAYASILKAGGNVTSTVSRKTDILINAEGNLSGKMEKALALREQGHHIRIVSEKDFMRMLETLDAIDVDETKYN